MDKHKEAQMDRSELISAINKQATFDISRRDISFMTEIIFDIISKELRDNGRQQITGFGTFTTYVRKSRARVVPGLSEPVVSPPVVTIKFRPGPAILERIS